MTEMVGFAEVHFQNGWHCGEADQRAVSWGAEATLPLDRDCSTLAVPVRDSRDFNPNLHKVFEGTSTFYGLRKADLTWLEGHNSVLCFLWDHQELPLLVPYGAFEDVFASTAPAQDGQYKVQVLCNETATELYVAGVGRFNVDGYFGWNELNAPIDERTRLAAGQLTHSQVQTLLGAIGFAKGNDIWCPLVDRSGLDWSITKPFPLHDGLPARYDNVKPILSEIDVVWVRRGAGDLVALFEVEHTTSIYSGLLRFNDVHLNIVGPQPRFSVVANDARRSVFARQLNRPTFQRSGLAEICTFMQYENVLDWHGRLAPTASAKHGQSCPSEV